MNCFDCLFEQYDSLVFFDTETTGLEFATDEIIEFSAVVLKQQDGEAVVTRAYDELIQTDPGTVISPFIENLTGITNDAVREKGVTKAQVCKDISELFAGNALLLAYNAHFDLSFLFYMLMKHGDPAVLKGKDKIDLLTVYKDRHSYPHKLCNAIEVYELQGKVVNSHRAIDDVFATVAVMEAMMQEKDDMNRYINLFGYNSKYGLQGKPIRSIQYKSQDYDPPKPLYEL